MSKARSDSAGHARGLQHMADKMAAHFGQPVTDFRYAGTWVDEEWLPNSHR